MSDTEDSKTKINDYTVKMAGFIHGDWKPIGAAVKLTAGQARVFERSGHIALKAPPKALSKAEPTKASKPKESDQVGDGN